MKTFKFEVVVRLQDDERFSEHDTGETTFVPGAESCIGEYLDAFDCDVRLVEYKWTQ